MFDLLILAAALALLYFGAEWLLRGATGLARSFGASELAIGVALASATSAPELAVSLAGAAQAHSPLVLGSVVGANIANIGLALGVALLISPPRVDGRLFRREVPYLWIATLAAGPILLNGHIDRAEGALFLVSGAAFTVVTFHWAKARARGEGNDVAPPQPRGATDEQRSAGLLVLLALTGVAALVGGGRFAVSGAVGVARDLGVSERFIGLTVVGLGCALPELVMAVVAARRGRSELAVAHIVSSNVLNLLVVLGFTTLLLPVEGRLVQVRFELIAMTLLSFALGMSLHRARTLTRAEGASYVASYAAFLGWLMVHG